MSSLPTPLPLLLLFSSLWSSSFVGMSLDFQSYNISENLNFENILCKPRSFLFFFSKKKKKIHLNLLSQMRLISLKVT